MEGDSNIPVSKIELNITCKNLKSMDAFSQSDPCCVLYMETSAHRDPPKRWVEIGRTEALKNNPNPVFTQNFVVDYYFEETQHIKFVIYDIDNASDSLADDDVVGEMTCTIADIVSSRGQTLTRTLLSTRTRSIHGHITVRAEELAATKDKVALACSARKLAKKDFFGSSDPFFVIMRVGESSAIPVYKSEHLKKNINPVWKPTTMMVSKLCNGDYDRPLRIEVYDYDSDIKSEFIGACTVSLNALLTTPEFALVDDRKGKGNKQTGTFVVNKAEVVKEYSFLDYVAGGCEVSMVVAVDFTASNGDPRAPTSLHYLDPAGQPNEYERAIRAIGDIVAPYDSDRMYPAFGFGAKLPPAGTVSHCFALNGVPTNPECYGIEGILGAYRQAIYNVTLYGPTLFTPILDLVRSSPNMQVAQDRQKYTILLIITDGVITDMDNTIHSIVAASKLPMSVIIVGVGQEDFSQMEFLDSDGATLASRGVAAERDCVQFVPLRKYKDAPHSLLAKDTLAEIPKQFLEFMKKRGIVPNARLAAHPVDYSAVGGVPH